MHIKNPAWVSVWNFHIIKDLVCHTTGSQRTILSLMKQSFTLFSVPFSFFSFPFSLLIRAKKAEGDCLLSMPGDDGGFWVFSSVQFTQSRPTICDPMLFVTSTPGLSVHHQLPEFTQTHVHRVSDAIQLPHPLLSPSPPAFNLSQHQGLFQRVISSHRVAKVLEFQFQHQSFQWIFRTDFL